MSSKPKELKPYKEVRLIGPDWNGALSGLLEDGFMLEDGCIIIGDGSRYLTTEEVEEKLRGRIDKNTRIHVCAHGEIKESEGYCLKLFQDLEKAEDALRFIDSATDSPVQLYLNSCHSGAANHVISSLKPGSVLITVSEADGATYDSPFFRSWLDFDKTTEEVFLYNIRNAFCAMTFNKKKDNGEVFQYTYRPFSGREVRFPKTARDYIVFSENEFIEEAVMFGGCNASHFRDLGSFGEPSEGASKGVLFAYVAYLISERKITGSFIKELCDDCLLDVNGKSDTGFPLLHHAANVLSFNKEAFDVLVSKGADVNAHSANGEPLLYYVANNYFFQKESFEALVAAGADVNAKTSEGVPIVCECLRGGVNIESLRGFLSHGAVLPREKPDFILQDDWEIAHQEFQAAQLKKETQLSSSRRNEAAIKELRVLLEQDTNVSSVSSSPGVKKKQSRKHRGVTM